LDMNRRGRVERGRVRPSQGARPSVEGRGGRRLGMRAIPNAHVPDRAGSGANGWSGRTRIRSRSMCKMYTTVGTATGGDAEGPAVVRHPWYLPPRVPP
jgi:hypothetical protein